MTITNTTTTTTARVSTIFGFCLIGLFFRISFQVAPGPWKSSKDDFFRIAGASFYQDATLPKLSKIDGFPQVVQEVRRWDTAYTEVNTSDRTDRSGSPVMVPKDSVMGRRKRRGVTECGGVICHSRRSEGPGGTSWTLTAGSERRVPVENDYVYIVILKLSETDNSDDFAEVRVQFHSLKRKMK